MKCPACGVDLKMTDRQGVEIDYCPQCRGVWLDRGELDKIIERSSTFSEARREDEEGYTPFGWREEKRDRDKYYDDRRKYGDDEYKRRKRKSFLGDLFDFD